ncbi:MAG: hypothetical protein ACE5MK_10260 [Acidobacteriota bacterium]
MRRPSPKLALLLIGALLAGCTQTKAFFKSESNQPQAGVKVLLMPPDIELSVLTAGGLLEPKADWTATARLYVTDALEGELRTKNVHMTPYEPPTDMPSKDHAYIQLLKLHEAVGDAILMHKYNPQFELPTKKDKFDWSLGQDLEVLREDNDAHYGLFIHFRDSYASGGRVALIILAAVAGVGVPGGRQVAFASLVDLKTGDIVWFNRLISSVGDLRNPEAAAKAVDQLLADLPL